MRSRPPRPLLPAHSALPPPAPARNCSPWATCGFSCQEVLAGPNAASILQLGSPGGYPPLRHYLLEEARREGVARSGDDVVITNGCQQALDLLQRVLVRPGDTVLVEDPVYPGLKNLSSARARNWPAFRWALTESTWRHSSACSNAAQLACSS